MATITPYDQASWATFTPLTAQEILMPALHMREAHDKLGDEYGAINDELEKVDFIVQNEDDPVLTQRYGAYRDSLNAAINTLDEKGLTGSSRRSMLNLRSQFQKDITPISLGYKLKLQEIDTYNQMKAKDPTYIGNSPYDKTVTDYINNGLQPFEQQGVSGALVTKMAHDYLVPFSKVSSPTQFRDVLVSLVGDENIGQYSEAIQKFGVMPQTEKHDLLMQTVSDLIKNSLGVDAWASSDQLKEIQGFIKMAETATIGEEKSKFLTNSMFDIKVKEEAERKLKEETPPPSPHYFYPTEEENEVILTDLGKRGEDLENMRKDLEKENFNPLLGRAKEFDTYEEFLEGTGLEPKKSNNPHQDNPEVYANPKSLEFDPYKAAFEITKNWERLTEEEKRAELSKLVPQSTLDKYSGELVTGTFSAALAAKWAMSAGVSASTIGGMVATLGLPALAAGLFTSNGNVESMNREQLVKALEAMDSKVPSQVAWVKDSLQQQGHDITDEEALNILENDMNEKHRQTNALFNFRREPTLAKYEEDVAMGRYVDIRNKPGFVVHVNKNGKKTKPIPLSSLNKEFKSDVVDRLTDSKNVQYKGHNSLNSYMDNKPTYQYIYEDGGDRYYIHITAPEIEQNYSTSRAVYNAIEKGITKPVWLDTKDGELIIVPRVSRKGIQYNILTTSNSKGFQGKTLEEIVKEPGIKVYSPEGILQADRIGLGDFYFDQGAPRSEVLKKRTGQ